MNYPTEHNESLANLPFNEAFGRARRTGAQTFWWPRGRYKVYNTELGSSDEIVGIPNLPVIDTNFNIPEILYLSTPFRKIVAFFEVLQISPTTTVLFCIP